MSAGEFEGRSLDALHAMVASAKPKQLAEAGEALSAICSEVDSIASDLNQYIGRVAWEGEAGDAFREWGRKMVLETRMLGQYSAVVGQEMVHAGQALTEAQAAVPTPVGQCFADPEKEAERIADEKPKREEAINQLYRLSSHYRAVSDRMAAEPEPNFEPLPHRQGYGTSHTPVGTIPRESVTAVDAGASSTGPTSDGSYYAEVDGGKASYTNMPVYGDGTSIGTEANSTAPAPASERHVTPAGSPASVSSSGGSNQPVTPPAWTGAGRAMEQEPMPSRSVGESRNDIRHVTPSQNAVGPHPRGSRDGIVGGTPLRQGPGGTTPRLPQGTVIGGERSPMMRGPVNGVGGPIRSGGGNAPGLAGPGYASQPGGRVGTPRPMPPVGTHFTPGGSGLLRGSQAAAMARPSGAARRAVSDERTTDARPNYLSEEEETWSVGRRNAVPPVIDD